MGVSATPQRGIVNAAADVYTRVHLQCNGTSYVQLIASTATAILVTHIIKSNHSSLAGGARVVLATGAAASEVVIATVTVSEQQGASSTIALPFPIRIPVSTRVAMSLADTSDALSYFGILYVNESSVI